MAGLLANSDKFSDRFCNRQKITERSHHSKERVIRKNYTDKNKPFPILLLVSNNSTREYLMGLLAENNYFALLMSDPEQLLQSLKDKQFAIILIDCGAVITYGTRLLSKIKVACRHCRIIIFCDKEHLCDKAHRELIKEVLTIGVYACILAPYKEWEVLSMVSYYPQRRTD